MDFKVFKNNNIGEIRVIMIDDMPWFVGEEVTEFLKYKNSNKAIRKYSCRKERKKIPSIKKDGKLNKTYLISRSCLCSLILNANCKIEEFASWIYTEIFPQIYLENIENEDIDTEENSSVNRLEDIYHKLNNEEDRIKFLCNLIIEISEVVEEKKSIIRSLEMEIDELKEELENKNK